MSGVVSPLSGTHRTPASPVNSAGYDEGDPAIASHRDADEARARLVVADRLQRFAERRMHDYPHDDRRNREQYQYIVIVGENEALECAATLKVDQAAEQRELGGGDADAVGAAGHPEELEGEAPQHLAESERQDAEENARVAHAYEAEQRGDEQRAQEPAEDAQLHGLDAEVAHDERNRVSTHAEIGGMAERQQSGVAEQQIEAERRDGEDSP